MRRLLLIDGSNVLMRSIHAMYRIGLSSNGVPTGPLMNFINTVASLVREHEPTHVMVAWEGGHSERRLILASDYKANRKSDTDTFTEWKDDSFAMAQVFLQHAGVYQIRQHGVEADDLIAAAWRQTCEDEPSVIVSNDKDFLQLLDDHTIQVRLSSAQASTEVWGVKEVLDNYGIPPRRMPEYLALVGDSSDNVKGVPGIGPKRAQAIISGAKDWQEVLVHPGVAEHAVEAQIALQQVNLRTDYGDTFEFRIPPFEPHERSPELDKFLLDFDLDSIRSRYLAGVLWS